MNAKSLTLTAALLTLPAIISVPGVNGIAQAADIPVIGPVSSQDLPNMLDASAFGVSAGAGRGIRVGVVIGRPKAVSQRKMIVVPNRLR